MQSVTLQETVIFLRVLLMLKRINYVKKFYLEEEDLSLAVLRLILYGTGKAKFKLSFAKNALIEFRV